MDWREIFQIALGLAFVVSPPILLAWAFMRALKWQKVGNGPRGLFVYIAVYTASFLLWFSVLAVLLFTFAGKPMALRFPPKPGMPAFPWPPPAASAETTVPDNWLPPRGGADLADVAATLEKALRAAKYRKWSFSSVPDGFALVSQIEQIKADGTPSPEPARWSTDLPWVANMNLLEFVRALVNAESGYYRVIVFIVTSRPWPRTNAKPTGEEANQWLARGFTWLPPPIGELPYGPDHRTTVLVYEFQKTSKDTNATLLEPSPVSADEHMTKAGISESLSRR